VKRITPAVKGVSVSVLNYDDRLLLTNSSGAEIVVLDYQKKPYIRAAADGTVAVNTNSEAYYLNEDRFGEAAVPKGLGAQPAWKVVSRSNATLLPCASMESTAAKLLRAAPNFQPGK